jgi:hypothetical protein
MIQLGGGARVHFFEQGFELNTLPQLFVVLRRARAFLSKALN